MNTYKRILLLSGFILIILSIAACNTTKSTDSSGSSVADATPINTPDIPTPEPSALRSIILDSFNAQDKQSWRYNSTTVLANGETHTTLVEYQPTRRYHIVSDSQGGLIIYEDKVYMLQDGKWAQAEIPIDSIIDPEATKRLENTISDISYQGAQFFNDKAMWVCQYTAKQKTGDSEATIEVTIWISNDDRLPYRMDIAGQTLAIDGQTGEVKGIDSTSTVIYEYDPSIKITAPEVQ